MTLAPSASVTSCPVLYDAHGLLAVDKPEGVLSHPNPGTAKARSAFEGAYDFEERSFETPRGKIWLIHRLDQDTSGVLLAAREKSAARACRELFETGDVRKIYDALVAGKVLPGQGRWNDKIGVAKQKGRVRSRVLGGPPNAHTMQPYRLSVLPAGLRKGAVHQILRSPRLDALLAQARQQYDFVVLDTPPLLPVFDSALLANAVDGVLVVVAANQTPRKLLGEALNMLDPSKVLGIVFNRDAKPLFGYYDAYYKDYFPEHAVTEA